MIGRTISHYKIVEKLGDGGMGVVYKAEDAKLKRTVALKFLPPIMTRNKDARQRFLNEAQIISRFDHTNICSIFDVIETDDNQICIAMPCYEGENLKNKIANGELRIEEVIDITMQIAEGLRKAHENGIVHRDIKPANIFITTDGVVKILDFGLAKLTDSSVITKMGSTAGTVSYMSPEQARGENVDKRTDIWSLGVVLYEMLTGERPFRSDYEQALIYSILNEDTPVINPVHQELPEHILTLCMRCLEKKRESRPVSMGEVLNILGSETKDGDHISSWNFQAVIKWKKAFIPALALLLIIAVYVVMKFPSQGVSTFSGRPILGILPIQNADSDTATSNWPAYIQWRFFDNFAGKNNLSVFDPVVINVMMDSSMAVSGITRDQAVQDLTDSTKINIMIDAKIRKSAIGYQLEVATSGVVLQDRAFKELIDIESDKQIVSAVDSCSKRILNLFYNGGKKNPETETDKWHPPKVHSIPAVGEFALGIEMNYLRDSLAEIHLKRAIQMDWAYILPRVILIQKLVANGLDDQAGDHFRILADLRNMANRYEQTLIDWAGALVKSDLKGQRRALESILDYSPGNGLMAYMLARLKYVEWDFIGCINVLTPILRTGWHYSPMYYLIAASYEQLGLNNKARRMLEESLTHEPVYPEIFSLLSVMYHLEKDSSQALRYETLYINANRKLGKPASDSYATLASICMARGCDEAASRLYKMAIKKKPNYAPYHQGLGDAQFYLGNTSAAVKEYKRVLQLDDKYAESYYRLGEIFEQQGNRKQSLYHTSRYLLLDSAGTYTAEARARALRLR